MQPSQKRYSAQPGGSPAGEAVGRGPAPGRGSRSAERYGGIQAKSTSAGRYAGVAPPASRQLAPLSGSGQALPTPLLDKMQPAFGTDLSEVRVHRDNPQPQALGALAFTQGQEIAFAPGQYAPSSRPGQELIGHELTHVAQQASGRVADPAANGSQVTDDSALESEADVLGARAARGEAVDVAHDRGASAVRPKAQLAPVQAKKGPIQAKKSKKKSAAKAVGKGLINVVFPVFTWKDFFENLEAGWKKEENPLLGKNKAANFGIKALITLKEIGQLVAGLATMAATIFGIASIFFPYLAPIGALCGLIATIAHAVTFVLRGIHAGLMAGKLRSLANARDPAKIEQKKKLEADLWGEIGAMAGNAIGVIFGGFGGAFSGSPAAMAGDASTAFAGKAVSSTAQAGTIGAATSSMSGGGANAVATIFGQGGNSLADAVGGTSSRHGKMTSERHGEGRMPQTSIMLEPPEDDQEAYAAPASRAPSLSASDFESLMDSSSDEGTAPALDARSAPPAPAAEDVAAAKEAAEVVLELNRGAQNPTVVPVDAGELDQATGDLDKLKAQTEEATTAVDQVDAAEPAGDGADVSKEEAAAADAQIDSTDAPAEDSPDSAPDEGGPESAPAEPAAESAPAESAPEAAPAETAVARSAPSSETPATAAVQTKRPIGATAAIQRKPIQARGGWFKRRVVNRVKKSLRKAKLKLMNKVYQLLGLDKKAAQAKQQLAELSAASGGARAAEQTKKAAAAAAAAQAQALKDRADQSK